MGLCGSTELTAAEQKKVDAEKKKARQLDKKLKDRNNKDRKLSKLLLLGAGESGKSTLFKQMQMYAAETTEITLEEREQTTELIFSNIISNAKVLAEQSSLHFEPETEAGLEARIFMDNQLEDDGHVKIDAEVAGHIAALWADPGIQKTYAERSKYQLNDSAAYFFNKLDEVFAPDWIPSGDDCLRVRVRTTGIVEHTFNISGAMFRMFDVGGQRNERKKWIHCFQDVTSLLFVVAISEFDQVLYEDDNTNRMTESLTLFEDIANSPWFTDASIILFLNKIDLFLEKIQTQNISDSACIELQNFDGDPRSEEDTYEFIKELFLLKAHTKKQIFPHKTCATDTDQVRKVFDSVKETIIHRSLQDAGIEY
jgi:GTPase SAR1 family protein